MTIKKIIIIAGGSGGHVFPGLAIAMHLIKKGWNIKWIGTRDRIESKLVPKHGIDINFINIQGLRNATLKTILCLPINVINAIYNIRKIIKIWSPDIALTMGGYVSGPGGLAAWCSQIPLLIHEQNQVPGLTNQWLSRISTKNMQAFSGTLKDAKTVGNPIFKNIINIPSPKYRFENRIGPLRILVVGGSQGASILNDTLPKVSKILKNKIIIWHQVGSLDFKKITMRYRQLGVNNVYCITDFIDDMAVAYKWADLIICRSGALTVSEISVVGLAAIFVPYPHKDQQQYKNAKNLKNIGAAKIINQSVFNTELIVKLLHSLTREKLFDMAKKAYSLGIRDSTEKISEIIYKTIKTHKIN
jgi:UDP-N-acetylglucosamine--N-acetylmuramyl-(pentapeptide) pyrophosphoryl-undecaprenol N-acetylglucosamine transferase